MCKNRIPVHRARLDVDDGCTLSVDRKKSLVKSHKNISASKSRTLSKLTYLFTRYNQTENRIPLKTYKHVHIEKGFVRRLKTSLLPAR